MHRLVKAKKIVTLFRYGYIAAFLVIALSAWYSHSSSVASINQAKGYAKEVNMAGRQRMLSQRISLYTRYLLFRQGAYYREELHKAIDEMASAHRILTANPDSLPANLRELYFYEGFELNDLVKTYLANARVILDNSNDWSHVANPSRRAVHDRLVGEQEIELLPKLDQAVKLYEMNATQAIDEIHGEEEIAFFTLLTVLILEAVLIFRPLIAATSDNVAQLESLIMHDYLTGVLNRRAFWHRAEEELSRAARHSLNCSLLVMDLDHFKRINDTYGHSVGDQVLIEFSQEIKKNLRKEDIFARTGGEEFSLLLPETDLAAARVVANKLLKVVAECQVELIPPIKGTHSISFSCSIGISTHHASDKRLDVLMERADKALYRSKEEGRNRVTNESELSNRSGLRVV